MHYTYQYPRPALTVDCVVFGFDEGELKVLLIERNQDLLGLLHPQRPNGFHPGSERRLQQAAPAVGFEVPSGAKENVVLFLRTPPGDVKAEIPHVRVDYSQGSHQYYWQNNIHYVLAPSSAC